MIVFYGFILTQPQAPISTTKHSLLYPWLPFKTAHRCCFSLTSMCSSASGCCSCQSSGRGLGLSPPHYTLRHANIHPWYHLVSFADDSHMFIINRDLSSDLHLHLVLTILPLNLKYTSASACSKNQLTVSPYLPLCPTWLCYSIAVRQVIEAETALRETPH